jgi:hypothetical protein
MSMTTQDFQAMTPSERKAASEKHRDLLITQEVLDALSAASQAKGSQLSEEERAAVYASFEGK